MGEKKGRETAKRVLKDLFVITVALALVFATACAIEALVNMFTGGGFTFAMPAILTVSAAVMLLALGILGGFAE